MAALPLERLAELGVLQGTAGLLAEERVLALGWPELEKVLPDRGLPRGVVEIASPVGKHGALRGGATTIALRTMRAIHAADEKAWCAWLVPSRAPMPYAPAAAQEGVDLERLLVVRPEPVALARTAVKVAASGAFDLVVVDAHGGLDGRLLAQKSHPGLLARSARSSSRADGSVVVRKLALASEEKGTTFLLLTDAYAERPVPWPVALRLEAERRADAIALRITKDRRGRASAQHVVRLAS
ncbi:MAG TPA: recombinase A [Labilithrix sp.]